MKNNYLLLAIFLALILNTSLEAQTYDWIRTTLEVYHESNGSEGSRIETDYDTQGRESGYRYYRNGEMKAQRRDYQYNGRSITYFHDSYDNGFVYISIKYKVTYAANNWLQVTEHVEYEPDNVTELVRQITSYDIQGRVREFVHYYRGVIGLKRRDYSYNGREAIYWIDQYSSGQVTNSRKYKVRYCPQNWVRQELLVNYELDGVTEKIRIETTFDSIGREVGYKWYDYGVLSSEYRDYQYNGRTLTFKEEWYQNGAHSQTFNRTRMYYWFYEPNSLNEIVASKIKVFPNPTTNQVIVESSTLLVKQITVLNVAGNTVLTSTGNRVDVSSLPKGTYFVSVETNEGNTVKSIVKQ